MDMLFRNTLGPTAWMIMGAIPLAIFALYFLKLKRQPLEVPSTYLWHRVIEDLHVNSFWQRLRKSLLLFLQLLIAALAILALLRPGWQGETLEGERFIFLIDNSASMSATDAENGQSRLDEAKSRVSSLIDRMESSMSAMVIAFADQPVVVQEFTGNRRRLQDAVNRIQPTAAQTDFSGALRLADGFANPQTKQAQDVSTEAAPKPQPVELFILSDGRFGNVDDFSLGNLQPKFLPLGTETAENLAITALNTRRGEDRPDQLQAFVQLANASSNETTATVALHLNDQLIDATGVKLPARGTGSATFLLSNDAQGTLRAVVDPAAGFQDRLTVDNTAYAVLETGSDSRVLLVTPGNSALEAALETERAQRFAKIDKLSPNDLETPEFNRQVATGNYDLIIFDQCAPQKMPDANTLFIGRRPPLEKLQAGESSDTVFGPQIIDWDRSHPLLNLIELGGVQIVDAQTVKPPLGGRVLVDSTAGPLMAIAPRDRFEDVVLGFEIVGTNEAGQRTFNTDWPRRHSFPSFWLNVLEHFAQHSDTQEIHRPHELVELHLPPGERRVEMELPDGATIPMEVDTAGQLAFQDTERPGVYQVLRNGEVVKRFAVNLFDRQESDVALQTASAGQGGLNVVKSLEIGYVDVAAEAPNADIRKELWKPLLVLALVVLMVEWYIYNRRVYI